MEKITIKGFGPIKDAEIEVKKLLVLIGEQASGKSTIAKLIYFFKSLPDWLSERLRTNEDKNIDNLVVLNQTLIERFKECFPLHLANGAFTISYVYPADTQFRWVNYTKGWDSQLKVEISEELHHHLVRNGNNISRLRNEIHASFDKIRETSDAKDLQFYTIQLKLESEELRRLVNLIFGQQSFDKFFFIAGREAFESYPEVFEQHGARVLDKTLRHSARAIQTFDDELLLEFIDRARLLRNSFNAQPYSFEQRSKHIFEFDKALNRGNIKTFDIFKHVHAIIKGDYQADHEGEFLRLDDKKRILLKNASSGQKESVRLILDLFNVLENSSNVSFLRIIEEPEAHLFPVAQKNLIELLASMANANPENQVIITTHSPYVLTTLNNLLFATRVAEKNPAAEPEIAEIVPPAFRIDPGTFGAYSLGNSLNPEAKYCESIVDSEMGMIDQNYLDSVSDLLGLEFDHLRNIHIRSFQRHGRQ